jgi:Lhr-like helicase
VARTTADPLAPFHAPVRAWFTAAFEEPTAPQALGWPAIARGESTLILSPTGSGKTLTAFLWCLDRLMFSPQPPKARRCRVLYVSPLKALAVDVERNLRAPLAGIAQVAERLGEPFVAPAIAIRTGDTPQSDRARFQREPADILITTPESLYLLLTSNAREALSSIETIIIDEIHALVPTKRGAHLAVSLERLEERCERPPQRIGLSATQRPLDEVARFLGGTEPARASAGRTAKARPASGKAARYDDKKIDAEIEHEFTTPHGAVRYRPVTIVDAGKKKALKLTIEVPVEDMAKLTTADDIPSGPASVGDSRPSIWSAIHPRLLELILAHRSTLIFVNSRRLAERLAGALNELAGETLVRSHHGSIARPQRVEVEDLLKAGQLRGLVATSSLELGIDMGAIDLVVQIEAPPSVASGLQRIGRGGHQANAISEGVVFPKFRGDLVACAAVAKAMHDGAVEATRFPRNPLDIVAQQLVAMASMDDWPVDALFAAIRRAAPFAELSRTVFDGVLDMLSGRYPSDEFAELRPRVTWDRVAGTVSSREGAKRVAIANGGTIPDRGLYGVFLLGAGPGAARVGELDEEMVFESRVGETFVLGASSWRIEEITHDRVIVSPAPGEPGKMPFWKGDRPGRPLELGLAIGRLMHELIRLSPAAALDKLTREHDLDARAAENLLQYLRDQTAATRALPDASTVVVERVRDELGDWRVCVLSPRGGRVHAPWAMAVAAKIREEAGIDVETLWGDDGFVVRFPDVDAPPEPRLMFPDPEEVQALVVRQLGGTALFAAKFPRERRSIAAPPPPQTGSARAVMAAAETRRGSAGRGVALRLVPGPARDLSRVPAGCLRHAGAHRHAGRRPQPESAHRHRRLGNPVAVRGIAAVHLRGELHLRRRRAARRTPRAGAVRRSIAAARTARGCGAPRASRRGVDRSGGAPAAAAGSAVSREERGWATRSAAVPRRSDARRDCRPSDLGGRRGECGPIGGDPARAGDSRRGRSAIHRDRGRGPLPRRVGRATTRRCSRVAASAGARSDRRPRAALRADARAVHRRGIRRPIRARAGRRRGGAAAADWRRTPDRRRIPAGRHAARVDRCQRAADASTPVARQAAARSGTGRATGPRPVRHHLAGDREAPSGCGTHCSTRSSSCRERRSRRRSWKPRSFPRASTSTIRRISTR